MLRVDNICVCRCTCLIIQKMQVPPCTKKKNKHKRYNFNIHFLKVCKKCNDTYKRNTNLNGETHSHIECHISQSISKISLFWNNT